MNEIILNTSELPVTNYGAQCIAPSPFVHADRTVPFHIMIYVTKGQIFVSEDQVDFEINAGEMLFLKGGVHHFGKKTVKQGTTWYYIHFYTPVFPFCTSNKREMDSFSYPYSHSPVEYVPSVDLNLPISQEETAYYSLMLPKKLTGISGTSLEEELVNFIEYLHSGVPFRRWEINVKLFKFLSNCAFFEQKNTMLPFSLSDRIALYLQNHSSEPFKASLLEKHFYLSYKHMEAVFKAEKKSTIQQYHTSLRLYKACDLLHSTELSIGEIGERLGFADSLYFSRCFHKGIGMSPSEYRRKIPIG